MASAWRRAVRFLPGCRIRATFGTFPRVLGHYVREEKILSLESAVWKMSGYPAQRLGLKDRGLIKQGFQADVVVFDPADDRATARAIPIRSITRPGLSRYW